MTRFDMPRSRRGTWLTGDDKSVAGRMRIVREITRDEIIRPTGVFYMSDCTAYYKEGKLHREDGPAIERKDGTKE